MLVLTSDNFIFLLITKPYLRLAIKFGVIFILRIALIDVVYAEDFTYEDEHYDKIIFDINEIIQSSPNSYEVVNNCMCYASAVIDPNILSKNAECVGSPTSKFNLYMLTFGTHRPMEISTEEFLARNIYEASVYSYNCLVLLKAFEHPSMYQANPAILKESFYEAYAKITANNPSYYKSLRTLYLRDLLVKDALFTIRRLHFPSSL